MELLTAVVDLFLALFDVFTALARVIVPWLPLIAWIAFWTLAVNWQKLFRVLVPGFGWIPVLLLMFVTILVWGAIAPPPAGSHQILGLNVSNYIGKALYIFGLAAITALCGSVQLSGCCDSLCRWDAEEPASEGHASAHSH